MDGAGLWRSHGSGAEPGDNNNVFPASGVLANCEAVGPVEMQLVDHWARRRLRLSTDRLSQIHQLAHLRTTSLSCPYRVYYLCSFKVLVAVT